MYILQSSGNICFEKKIPLCMMYAVVKQNIAIVIIIPFGSKDVYGFFLLNIPISFRSFVKKSGRTNLSLPIAEVWGNIEVK